MFGRILDLLNPTTQEDIYLPSPPRPLQARPSHPPGRRSSNSNSNSNPSAPLPAALAHRPQGFHEGLTVMGNAVVDVELPADVLLELVPPEEAVTVAPLFLHEGGCFIFSDDYVLKYPQSKVASLVRQFQQIKRGERKVSGQEEGVVALAKVAKFSEDDDPLGSMATAGATPSISSTAKGVTSVPKNKLQHVRDIVREARKVDRPLFRRQDATAVYGQSQYVKRDFHAILDKEHPIEYFI